MDSKDAGGTSHAGTGLPMQDCSALQTILGVSMSPLEISTVVSILLLSAAHLGMVSTNIELVTAYVVRKANNGVMMKLLVKCSTLHVLVRLPVQTHTWCPHRQCWYFDSAGLKMEPFVIPGCLTPGPATLVALYCALACN